MPPKGDFLRFIFGAVCGILAAGVCLRAQPAPGPGGPGAPMPAANSGDYMVDSFKLEGGSIDDVLGALETYSGKSIIRSGALPTAQGGYTLVINHVPKSELVLALETLLTLNQVGVVPLGDRFLKVVQLSLAKTEAPEFIAGSTLDLPPSDKLATKVFQLNFLRVGELFAAGIQSLYSPGIGAPPVILEKANAALVTDTVSNLQRTELLIDELDRPMANGFVPKFYPLQHAKAADLANKIKALITGPLQNQVGTATSFTPDERTNQLIVITDPREIPFFDTMVSKLDVASDPDTQNEVIPLKNADAKDLSTILSSLVSGQNANTQKANAQSVRPGETTLPNTPAGQGQNNALNAAMQGLGISTTQFSALITIEPDERTNSIVVSGTREDVTMLRALIQKLDGPLAQVRIQVIIAEVTLSDTDISGISALGLTVGQNTTTGATQVLSLAGGGSSTAASGTSIAGWDFSGGTVNPLAFNAAFNPTSAGTKNLVHVVQAPVLVTAHNKKAEVIVGEQVPIINGGQSTLAATGTTPVTSFNSTYQNVATDLTITPLIGDDGSVQMQIDQKVNDIGGQTTIQAGDTQPIIETREVTAYLTCMDGQMCVLGGLQKTEKTTDQNKVGFLYEIPILSQLLGSHTDDVERTELLFFIRPEVIKPQAATADARQRIDEMTNSKDINKFLANPTPQSDSKTQNFLDRFKSD